jgi:hypothetical protein
MLNINADIVCFVIAKVKEFQAKEEVVIPEVPNNPSEDWARQVLADHLDDLTMEELRAAVDDLEPDHQADLIALMWLGRGDYDLAEWAQAREDAAEATEEDPTNYLLAHPLAAEYLEEGLSLFDLSCED